MKTLVAYFSVSGNTKKIAQELAQIEGETCMRLSLQRPILLRIWIGKIRNQERQKRCLIQIVAQSLQGRS